MAFLALPVAFIWFYTSELLLLLGQDVEISNLSGIYIRYLIPGIFPYFAFECIKRYLQCQGIMSGTLFVIMIASPINIFLQWCFIFHMEMGLIGAAIATSITYSLLPILSILYIFLFKGGDAWGGWDSREAFSLCHLGEFMRLGVPGVLMMCSEWWAFEIVALMAGWFGEKTLAAQTVVLSTTSLCYMIPLGVSIASSTKVG